MHGGRSPVPRRNSGTGMPIRATPQHGRSGDPIPRAGTTRERAKFIDGAVELEELDRGDDHGGDPEIGADNPLDDVVRSVSMLALVAAMPAALPRACSAEISPCRPRVTRFGPPGPPALDDVDFAARGIDPHPVARQIMIPEDGVLRRRRARRRSASIWSGRFALASCTPAARFQAPACVKAFVQDVTMMRKPMTNPRSGGLHPPSLSAFIPSITP